MFTDNKDLVPRSNNYGFQHLYSTFLNFHKPPTLANYCMLIIKIKNEKQGEYIDNIIKNKPMFILSPNDVDAFQTAEIFSYSTTYNEMSIILRCECDYEKYDPIRNHLEEKCSLIVMRQSNEIKGIILS